ncbi:Flp pilus assembly protein CpaB [Massilia sp. P8910]|uniref:Flp pilus assembly protein CpaB n=1 Tax=Massilia antarctica TaxID=2765360 RepID=UPI0006BB8DDF|nr:MULTISPECIES: Flp pilus assembly protein CpaB [Massilia]MCE3607610.1 Flp pilus assembly protein CpaB [Massilia antarctica]MCY0911956.1 Flp pilus assembly protein CpaB [Massilia sp. H27-R4]CUI06585.1 Flp pilus assembly protein RcpC/CpaB [Janthinobacterium sp. CG23_2]CUU30371.1 Flp pilus assembly protein RcpC/CpaB [Janthinobacterium sp. CG23_2]
MKNKRALLTMGVAVLLGIGAVILASLWLLGQPGNAASRIVVATGDISRGQRISPDMLRLVDWPSATMPKDAFKDSLKLSDRVLKTNVLKGEPLTEAKLAPSGTLGGLSALISEGKRAITVRVNDVIGVAGFALPGNYVDIIVHTERDPDEQARQNRNALHISKIVLERILVLAVAQEVSRDETKPKVVNAVTLEVTPEQAEELDLARGVGTLSLALRNQVDPGSPQTAGATKASLLDEPAGAKPAPVSAPKAAPPARPRAAAHAAARPAPVLAHAKRDCVSVLNGVTTSQECF